jgi:hypothetical protein
MRIHRKTEFAGDSHGGENEVLASKARSSGVSRSVVVVTVPNLVFVKLTEALPIPFLEHLYGFSVCPPLRESTLDQQLDEVGGRVTCQGTLHAAP